jgi:hypothetical protein
MRIISFQTASFVGNCILGRFTLIEFLSDFRKVFGGKNQAGAENKARQITAKMARFWSRVNQILCTGYF